MNRGLGDKENRESTKVKKILNLNKILTCNIDIGV